ncbi:Protein kinase byr2 OS=Schizosaccharomyces pombe (strain 972 / ATCC 24843) GN=byr2 PE=1 SV=1 [Rhizoctonia solani AG-1 IB]|uniref:Protein kinase byr2 n=1 Tax=Thanatephorus cucumeris (strain AG1-IB / isolate 7/3/14) TaxID=1108050 RepID=A0A0B7G692_THACB|nr:Protein kinase byr2 OS=Schizosaccharomyces pombe (strain 972 / ATCC 24843) GN=byr2 PE=1 SV=1 [Rhizoctonia solani AG-1 IB]
MIRQGMISAAAVTPLRPATNITPGSAEWPDKLEDYSSSLAQYSKELISNKSMADVWIYRIQGDSAPTLLQADERKNFDQLKNDDRLRRFVVKVPRLPGGLSATSPEDDQFLQLLRLAVKERFDLDHENLVELIGLDRSYGRYPGIVLEYCPYGDLTHYKRLIVPYEKDNQRYLREISQGLQYLHNLPSVVTHGDLTPDNILVDGQGTLKLSILSFARVAASLPASSQVAVRPDNYISARYSSPELLADSSRASPESDIWSFGCVAFWIYTDLHPYPSLKKEHDIVRAIESEVLPNDMDSIRNIEDLGSHLRTGADSPWITDGTLSHILRCWDPNAKARPSASDILKYLGRLPNTDMVRWRPPSSVPDLTGAVQTPGGRNIIGWSAGTWRRIYTRRAQNKTPDIIKLWWWRGVQSRGFFRKNVDVIVKSAKSDKGEFEDPVQQVYRHELILLNQMKHANIVSILGFTTDPTHLGSHLKVPALVIEYCARGRLREYCPSNQAIMSETDRINLIRGISQALKYIHDEISEGSIVHGNLSMDSVVVDATGTPKLTNFEFSCQYQHTDNPLRAQVLHAPPLASHPTRWDAPELFQDVSDSRAPFPTRYTDLWSLGSLFVFVSRVIPQYKNPVINCPKIFSCKLPYAQSELPGAIARLINGEKPYTEGDCPDIIRNLASSLWEDIPYQRPSASKILEMIESL